MHGQAQPGLLGNRRQHIGAGAQHGLLRIAREARAGDGVHVVVQQAGIQPDLVCGASIGAVVGGAMFGDNLSVISDTTIAATRTQGCGMREKFRANLWIAAPAALATIALLIPSAMSVADSAEGARFTHTLSVGLALLLIVAGAIGVSLATPKPVPLPARAAATD